MTDRGKGHASGERAVSFDFSPDPRRYDSLIPKGTVEERLRGHWERVGQHLWHAARQLEHEHEITSQTKEEGASPG